MILVDVVGECLMLVVTNVREVFEIGVSVLDRCALAAKFIVLAIRALLENVLMAGVQSFIDISEHRVQQW
jgi:hypothetical protein